MPHVYAVWYMVLPAATSMRLHKVPVMDMLAQSPPLGLGAWSGGRCLPRASTRAQFTVMRRRSKGSGPHTRHRVARAWACRGNQAVVGDGWQGARGSGTQGWEEVVRGPAQEHGGAGGMTRAGIGL